jgi:hypothetical protein
MQLTPHGVLLDSGFAAARRPGMTFSKVKFSRWRKSLIRERPNQKFDWTIAIELLRANHPQKMRSIRAVTPSKNLRGSAIMWTTGRGA